MRKVIFIFNFIFLIGCARDKSPISIDMKYFPPQKLILLELDNISYFWKQDIPINTSNFMGAAVEKSPGFLKGVEFRSENHNKQIAIYVFDSGLNAINLMNDYGSYASAHIEKGEYHELISQEWWYLKWPSVYGIFVNQLNTIICVNYTFDSDPNYEELVINTAAEIASRINTLSN